MSLYYFRKKFQSTKNEKRNYFFFNVFHVKKRIQMTKLHFLEIRKKKEVEFVFLWSLILHNWRVIFLNRLDSGPRNPILRIKMSLAVSFHADVLKSCVKHINYMIQYLDRCAKELWRTLKNLQRYRLGKTKNHFIVGTFLIQHNTFCFSEMFNVYSLCMYN